MVDPELRESELDVSNRLLRQFAALWLVIFGALATLQFVDGAMRRSAALAVVAVAVGVPGLVKPPMIGIVFRLAMTLAMPIGWVVSRVLLGLAYFAVFAPLGLVFRLIGRDALARRRRPEAPTYWTIRDQPTDPERYLRQS